MNGDETDSCDLVVEKSGKVRFVMCGKYAQILLISGNIAFIFLILHTQYVWISGKVVFVFPIL